MEKVYLVIARKSEEGKDEDYCVDVGFYCAGIYTDYKQAVERAEDFDGPDEYCYVQIHELEVNKDLFVYRGHISDVTHDDIDKSMKHYLGGASYYE